MNESTARRSINRRPIPKSDIAVGSQLHSKITGHDDMNPNAAISNKLGGPNSNRSIIYSQQSPSYRKVDTKTMIDTKALDMNLLNLSPTAKDFMKLRETPINIG